MSEPSDLLTDDGQVDARLLNGRNDNLRRHNTVSAAECAAMRRTMEDQGTYAAVCDVHDVAHKTARRHATGACAHDVGPEPCSSDRSYVDAETCAAIRERARAAGSYSAAAREFGVSAATARRHARGDCGHDVDTRRVL